MKKSLVALGVLFIYSIGSTELLACGEKFLVASRGTRYQRAGQARQSAAILVYLNASSALPKAFEKVSDETVRKAGYRLTSVANTTELEQALRQGGWDLVLTDLADSATVRGRIQGSGGPMVVPVAYNVTGTVLAQAKKDFQRVLKGPIKSQAFLDALDDALALRAKLVKSKTA
jgi:CheY-like chemotaxis protein